MTVLSKQLIYYPVLARCPRNSATSLLFKFEIPGIGIIVMAYPVVQLDTIVGKKK